MLQEPIDGDRHSCIEFLDTLFVTTIGASGTIPSEPGRDGFEPGATLAIEGLGVKGIAEPRFGETIR